MWNWNNTCGSHVNTCLFTCKLYNPALVSFFLENTSFPPINLFYKPGRTHGNNRPDQCTHLLLSPSSWFATNYNELMAHVTPGKGRSPMTSSDAETDFKPQGRFQEFLVEGDGHHGPIGY